MNTSTDTIVAPATASGGAIAVIRLSGPEAIACCDRIFRGRKPLAEAAGHTLHYGEVIDGDRTIDDVVAAIYRAPHSYTGRCRRAIVSRIALHRLRNHRTPASLRRSYGATGRIYHSGLPRRPDGPRAGRSRRRSDRLRFPGFARHGLDPDAGRIFGGTGCVARRTAATGLAPRTRTRLFGRRRSIRRPCTPAGDDAPHRKRNHPPDGLVQTRQHHQKGWLSLLSENPTSAKAPF